LINDSEQSPLLKTLAAVVFTAM